jgi:ABC-type polysaccharide/polyol phosphate export permease
MNSLFKADLISLAQELYSSKNVLSQLVGQQLTLRYRRTVLGYFWTLVNPLLMMSVMALVFSGIFKADLKTFAIFLFAGMIPWNFLNSVVIQSGSSFINNEGLIKKIYVPKFVFPLSVTLSVLVDSILSFFVLFALILLIGGQISWSILVLPFAYLILFFFSLGLGLIFAIVTVFFRDLQHVTIIAMQGLFFLTPIFYKKDAIIGSGSLLISLNPIVPFIDLFRAPLFDASLPSLETLLLASMISFFTFSLGMIVFFSQHKKIVFRL